MPGRATWAFVRSTCYLQHPYNSGTAYYLLDITLPYGVTQGDAEGEREAKAVLDDRTKQRQRYPIVPTLIPCAGCCETLRACISGVIGACLADFWFSGTWKCQHCGLSNLSKLNHGLLSCPLPFGIRDSDHIILSLAAAYRLPKVIDARDKEQLKGGSSCGFRHCGVHSS